jgi:hypothetical protein
MVYTILETCLKATAEKSIGPTFTTRNLFLISSILYNTQTYFDSSFETFDNYPKANFVISNNYIPYLYIYSAEIALPILNSTNFSNSIAIINFLQNSSLFKDPKYIQFKKLTIFQSFFSIIKNSIQNYLTDRNNDGIVTANVQIPSSDLPNGSNLINPNEVIDFSQYSEPLKWTPINTNTYLTPQWGNIRGFLSNSVVDEYNTFVDRFLAQVNFEDEVKNTFDVSLHLDDKQKCIAEFWAGGKNTITPPGFWNLFLIAYFQKYFTNNYKKQAQSFMILNTALFQTSIIVWGIKRTNFQARPIQTIRYYFPNQTIDYYFGNGISSSLWKPYQPDDFVTPPFPDFISGHSTFSSVGATILSKLIGNNLVNLDLSIDHSFAPYLSSVFSNPLNVENELKLHCFTIFPQTSSVNTPLPYPTKAVQMVYNSWDDMAIEAGVSRIYGGIHYESSNYSGYLVGNKIAKNIMELFDL